MDVVTPRTLDEALRLKAERPGARCILGGTDVMAGFAVGSLSLAAMLCRPFGGRLADDGEVHHRAQRVDIGVRSLFERGVAGVLFDRRVARLEDDGQPARMVADDLARRTEVQQHGLAVVLHDDVVRRDVAVHDIHRVE